MCQVLECAPLVTVLEKNAKARHSGRRMATGKEQVLLLPPFFLGQGAIGYEETEAGVDSSMGLTGQRAPLRGYRKVD